MSTSPAPILFDPDDELTLAEASGTLVVFAGADGTLPGRAGEADAAMGGTIARALADAETKLKPGETLGFTYPAGLAARKVLVVQLGEAPDRAMARKAGGAIAKALGKGDVALAAAGAAAPELVVELVYALVLRLYDFREYKSANPEDDTPEPSPRTIRVYSDVPEALATRSKRFAALAEGVFFARDLVNEPANRLTTDEFAARLAAMQEIGIEVEILGEAELEAMGARALLAVGQGSASESKLVVMRWMNGAEGEAPLCLVGKGVVFDTGGISIKPASGMEEMTMDMGGAGVVAGVMRALALRQAKANVVGIVGLVENMPDGKAQRPGDIVKSMKGDTIEVINTDAEGRLVLADALWYAQETFNPAALVDLATLTGAVIIALGHHNAGYYATDEAFAGDFAAACEAVGDPAWRLPLGKPYADQIKSRLADIKNVGGRSAGSITAAEFLHRFVKDGTPWIHIDIAGVTLAHEPTELAPKGATGWGVAALDDLVARRWEA